MMEREKQIQLMESAEERAHGVFRRWLDNPEFRAALHRYDEQGAKTPKKVALCG